MSFKVINFFMSKSFKTFLKHTAKDFHNQSVNPPVVRASTIIFKSMQHIRKTQVKAQKNPTGGHYDYGRQGTSTTHILQKILTKLEESYHVFTTPTGFGSVFLAIFSVVRPGDEIIAINGFRVNSTGHLNKFLKGLVNSEVEITFNHEGILQTCNLVLPVQPIRNVKLDGKGNKRWQEYISTRTLS